MAERKENPIRRNSLSERLPWVDLPVAGRTDPTPKPPTGSALRAGGKRLWESAWSTPSATQWGESEIPQIVLLCQLQDEWDDRRDKGLLTEMRHLRTALALTPKSRNELRWRIVDDGEVLEMNGKPTSAASVRRLRVADASA